MKTKILLITIITFFAGNLYCIEYYSKFNEEVYYSDTLMPHYPTAFKRIDSKKEVLNADSLFLLCIEVLTWNESKWVDRVRAVYYYDSSENNKYTYIQNFFTDVWIDNWKYTNTYNSFGKVIEYIIYYYDYQFPRKVPEYKKEEYYYNEKEELIEWKFFVNPGGDTLDWQIIRHQNYIYDTLGRLIKRYSKAWDGDVLIANGVGTFKYDSLGRRIEKLVQDSIQTYLINGSRNLYSYNDNDSLVEELYQTWNHEFFENTTRYIYFYNSSGLMIEHSWQKWNGKDWYNGWKREYLYNSSELNISEKHLSWNYIDWDTSYTISHTYDSLNNNIKTVIKDDNNGILINDERHDFEYDNFGNLTIDTEYEWKSGNWLELERFVYTYSKLHEKPDTPLNLEISIENNEFILSWDESKYPNVEYKIYRKEQNGEYGIIEDKTKQTNYTDNIIEYEKEYFYYVSSYNAINDLESGKSNEVSAIISDVRFDETNSKIILLNIHPNPVINILRIKTIEGVPIINIEIFSALGVKMIEANYSDKIDVSELPSGIYFLNYKSQFYKFIKL